MPITLLVTLCRLSIQHFWLRYALHCRLCQSRASRKGVAGRPLRTCPTLTLRPPSACAAFRVKRR